MRDNISYRGWFLEDGWSAIRKELEEGTTYMTIYTSSSEKVTNEYVYYSVVHPPGSQPLFTNPIVLFRKPWLAAYCRVPGTPDPRKTNESPFVDTSNTFLKHLSQRYSNMYCRLIHTSTVTGIEKVIVLLDRLVPFSEMLKGFIQGVDAVVPTGMSAELEKIDENTANMGILRAALAYFFRVMIILVHIGIMTSGFMHRAVAITKGNRRVGLTMDEKVVQLVKMYAVDTDYYLGLGSHIIRKLPFIGEDVNFFLVETFWKHLMSMWTSHHWIALTPPMKKLVEEIERNGDLLNDLDLIKKLEMDPYWRSVPTDFHDMVRCEKDTDTPMETASAASLKQTTHQQEENNDA